MLEPRAGETDDEYRKRQRRDKLLRILIPLGVLVALFGGIFVYVLLTYVDPPKLGERCDHKQECEPGAWCLLDGPGTSGTCVKSCEPNTPDACPPDTSCQMFDVVGKHGGGTGARTFACQPKQ